MKQIFIGLDIAKTTGWAAVIYDGETKEVSTPLVGTQKIESQVDLWSLLSMVGDIHDWDNAPIVFVCPEPTRFRTNYEQQFKMLGVIEFWAQRENLLGRTVAMVVKVDNHMRKEVFGTIHYPKGSGKKEQRAYRKALVMDRYKEFAHSDDEADAMMFIEYYKNFVNKNDTLQEES